MWLTDDAGANWESQNVLPLASGISSIETANVHELVHDPSDPDAFYAATGGSGMLYTYDNGASWQRPENSEVRSGFIQDISIDPSDLCTIYVAKSSRIMKTTDCHRNYDTETFVENNGKTVTALMVDWFNPSIVWAGTSAGDVIKSTDNGATWTTMTRLKDDVTDILVSNKDSRTVIVSTERKGIYRTLDGGDNWEELEERTEGFNDSDKGYFLTQSNDGSIFYYINEYGILKSTDDGFTWEAIELLSTPGDVHIWSMAVNPEDANIIYYGTDTTLYSTTDGGSNWGTRKLPSLRAAKALLIDADNVESLYTGFAAIED